jgi:hypothetical protein
MPGVSSVTMVYYSCSLGTGICAGSQKWVLNTCVRVDYSRQQFLCVLELTWREYVVDSPAWAAETSEVSPTILGRPLGKDTRIVSG